MEHNIKIFTSCGEDGSHRGGEGERFYCYLPVGFFTGGCVHWRMVTVTQTQWRLLWSDVVSFLGTFLKCINSLFLSLQMYSPLVTNTDEHFFRWYIHRADCHLEENPGDSQHLTVTWTMTMSEKWTLSWFFWMFYYIIPIINPYLTE